METRQTRDEVEAKDLTQEKGAEAGIMHAAKEV